MAIPPDLDALVATTITALHQHPERSLVPALRREIYAALDARSRLHGQRARAWLDILAVRHVLFCWRPLARGKWRASGDLPERLLVLAEQALCGAADRRTVEVQLDRAQEIAFLTGELETSPRYCGWCVCEAAIRALLSAYVFAALRHNGSAAPPSIGNPARCDDAASYAAIAVGGGTWHPVIDDSLGIDAEVGVWDWSAEEVRLRRAVFWEWWLREAIPLAWRRA